MRENLEVERINMSTGASRKIAAFAAPGTYPDRSYNNEQKDWLPSVAFLENDLIVRRSALWRAIVPAPVIISGTSIDNLFLLNRSVMKTFRLVLQNNYFELKDDRIPAEADGLLQHITCLQGIAEKSKLAIWEQIKENAEFPDSRMECEKYNNSVLITIFVTGSSGIWRDDRLFAFEGSEKINSIKIQEQFAKFNQSNSDISLIGVRPDSNYSYW